MNALPSEVPRVSWRLLDTGPGDPAWNMAVDEALLEGFDEAGDRPILRLYRWRPAAVSLGRFQPAADVQPPAGATLVRRLSGGAAIYHREDELTYAVVAPYRLLGRTPRAAYRTIHAALVRALERLGVRVEGPREAAPGPGPLHGMCFDRATDYDLCAGGRKLVGSAQRRGGGRGRRAFLQHGSLPLSPDPCSRGATSLAELLGRPVSPEEVATAVRGAVCEVLAADLVEEPLSETERARAEVLRVSRYAAPVWTRAR